MSIPQHRWLKQYPSAIRAEIDISRYASLLALLHESITENGDNTAYHHLGSDLSYKRLGQLSEQFSSVLQQTYNIKKGDRVALMLPNILAHPISMFGILRAGAIVVNINPLYTARELKKQLQDSGARMIVVMDIFTPTLNKVIHETDLENVLICRVGDCHPGVRHWLLNTITRYIKGMKPDPELQGDNFHDCIQNTLAPSSDVQLVQNDIAFLQYTGGTTGTSRGAMLTHGNILANSQQAYDWVSPAFKTRHPHVITALPLYHIFALMANCFVVMRLGGCSHLITNPRDTGSFLRELNRTHFHAITGVNTLFNTMLHHPDFHRTTFNSLELTLAGGMSVQRTTADAWHDATGSPIIEAYGLTESSPAICANLFDTKSYTGTIGLPLPSTEVSIRDENGNEVAADCEGELWARGPQVMTGYWHNSDETKQILTGDGWLKTGDIAVMSQEGYVRLVDRKKDMIIISGFNVYPNEIEDILTRHPDILEAGVIGVPHQRTGEAVKAIIVRKHKELTKESIIEHCRDNLAAYKVPKIIEFRDELPKTDVGKILRRSLR